MTDKERFLDLATKNIERDGIENALQWLGTTDFFIAPASTRFHDAFAGGLVKHSLNVYDQLVALNGALNLGLASETMAIVALFHDICKANVYHLGSRNVKDAQGRWQSVPTYDFADDVPLGHGEKSVILLQNYMTLTLEEVCAIRWHMGGFDMAAKGGERAINDAYGKFPLAVALHLADMVATYLV